MGPSQNAAFLGRMKDYEFVANEHCSVQEEFDGFYESMIALMNQFFPEKTITMTDKDSDYITPAIKAKQRLKNKLFRQGKMEQADILSIRIGHIIAKKNSTEFLHLDERSTSKDLWNAVKRIKSRSRQDTLNMVEGLGAEIMNQHYQTISTDSAYIEPRSKQTVAPGNTEAFTEAQIYQLLHQLKKTATGLDKLPSWLLRLGAPIFAEHLTYLFNRSLYEEIVPDQWKTAYICPVPKIPTPAEPVDFRPISMTPVLSRIFEKVIVKQFLYPAMLDPPIELSFENQFAFRLAGSCTAAIIALLHTVSTMLLENPYVIVIALDFSKAFDTVRHAALAKKLSILDMPDSVYNWMIDFLVQHEHCTVFEGNVSSTVKVNSSVIQG